MNNTCIPENVKLSFVRVVKSSYLHHQNDIRNLIPESTVYVVGYNNQCKIP